MKDENGNDISEDSIFEEAMNYIASACELLFELDSPEGIAAAFMSDSLLRYIHAIYHEEDPRLGEEILCERIHNLSKKSN